METEAQRVEIGKCSDQKQRHREYKAENTMYRNRGTESTKRKIRCTETGGRPRNGGKEHWDGTYQRCCGPGKGLRTRDRSRGRGWGEASQQGGDVGAGE
ncbi:hypothetical protein NDU88_005336 [Pleurodeles waltl]|uniref:Uncharacterized protein n=1 Tax=Pleurodeles waltl TaxID=8319 RepID=A0AAV7WB56_PLEWA|nr:hypothetical protein NDU88_005336 [Pleurodeles waltl]